MKKRIVWLLVSGLMALSLVLVSCAPQVTEEKEAVTEKKVVTEEKKVVTEKGVVTEKKVGMVLDALGRLVPKPQYGGTLNLLGATDATPGFSMSGLTRQPGVQWYTKMTNEELLARDRLKGPAGTGEWDGLSAVYPPRDKLVGNLAESWEIIQPNTLRYKIRKGIHWQDKVPTYGAEMTAEDVVYTFRVWFTTPGNVWAGRYPYFEKNVQESLYVDPNDPWTVVIKSAPGQLGFLFASFSNMSYIVPKALGPIDGVGFGTWKGVVGTGPFILTDYVSGSSFTYQRNPNYWKKDPLHPENQLPYLDGVKRFVISDLSTQLAAMRTGRVDILTPIETEDWEGLKRSNPELLRIEILERGPTMAMRQDVKPFDDVRVRQAMMMAIDHDEIVRDYYGDNAIKFHYPMRDIKDLAGFYVPLEEMPEVVQQMYGYHPDKAKRLLAEAGYPKGFSTSIIVSSAEEKNIDLLSVVKAYWAKVGVNLEIQVKEPAVTSAMGNARTYEHGYFQTVSPVEMEKPQALRALSDSNNARVNDPVAEEFYEAAAAAYLEPLAVRAKIAREFSLKLAPKAHIIVLPLPYTWTIWQPWVKGFHGESFPSYQGTITQTAQYVWIDQELKKSMGR